MPTISDVAKQAGVSVGTVSNVLNNVGNVSPANRAKVERAIKELGYVPSASARSLRSKRTRWLTMVVPTISHPHWQALVRGVEDAAHSRGYAVFLGNTDDNPVKQEQYLDVAISHNVAGVIIAPCDSNAKELIRLRRRNIPTVLVNRRIDGWETDGVYCDNVSAARALVRHLIELGHQRIAMISGPRRLSTMRERVTGYCIALAEAGLPIDFELIKYEQRQAPSSEYLTYELLDQQDPPSAIFAATDDVSKGVIEALGRRGLRIPHDIALVTFGDHTRAAFQFLTHILEPGYEMGINAVQLLFSRLQAGAEFEPRQVVLPTRLIVRYSCGSKLKEEGEASPSLLVSDDTHSKNMLVKPLRADEKLKYAELVKQATGLGLRAGRRGLWHKERPTILRLLQVLRHQEADRLPHLEFRIMSKSLYSHVLDRDISGDSREASCEEQSVSPESQIELARRLGMDAVICSFVWRPSLTSSLISGGNSASGHSLVTTWGDLDRLQPSSSLVEQLGCLERYLRVARGSDIGVAASFTSFFSGALAAVGEANALRVLQEDRSLLETLMDMVLEQQEMVVRAVCDRFTDSLAFVVIDDHIADSQGLVVPAPLFRQIYLHRMRRLIIPVKEHGKLVVLYTRGKIDEVLPILSEIGIDAIGPVEAPLNNIFELRKRWAGKMAFLGGFPMDVLASGSYDEIARLARQYCVRLASGGGYVFGCSAPVTDSIPPENFLTLVEAVQKYGTHHHMHR